MSGENAEHPQDLGENPTTDAPAVGGESAAPPVVPGVEAFDVPAPETVATPDAESAIEGFEVPPPPRFDAATPPAPSENAEAGTRTDAPALRKRRTWTPDDTWTSASAHKQEVTPPTAAQKAESRAAASRAATARDEATRNYVSPAAGGTDGQSYRGWTVVIYTGLTALLFGAIGLMVFLGSQG